MSQEEQTRSWQVVDRPSAPLPAGKALVVLSESDNVAVAARDIVEGEDLGSVIALEDIPKGHKIAIADVDLGEGVRKYAQVIGYASEAISSGRHVHTHNLEFRNTDPDMDYDIGSEARSTKVIDKASRATFMGYRRANGKVGTRNYVAIISSVNCSATAARRVAARFSDDVLQKYPNVDGVAAFIHSTGCGMASSGSEMDSLHRVMKGFATHPNVAGAVLLGLGCESNQIDDFLARQKIESGDELMTLGIQTCGGMGNAVEAGVEAVSSMLVKANEFKRSSCPASEITLALQCGGSDAWSGITANPALGHAVDLLVAQGGTGVIAETPETYGAEHLLTKRSASKEVANRLIDRIRWWEGYVGRSGGSMDNNPSPGNKLGGLTTILEKSLGAVAKGGTTSLNGFYDYGELVSESGFVMMDSPGYDPVSVTGQIASGCNLVAFTTGRGSAFGSKPAPTLKICTNSDTFQRMPDDMDVNAGVIISEGVPVSVVGEEIFERLLSLASGEPSKSEQQGMGDYEFIPWQLGATM